MNAVLMQKTQNLISDRHLVKFWLFILRGGREYVSTVPLIRATPYPLLRFYDRKAHCLRPTRQEAIMKMKWALSEFIVEGIDTNIDFQLALVKCDEFQSGDYNNRFLDTFKFE